MGGKPGFLGEPPRSGRFGPEHRVWLFRRPVELWAGWARAVLAENPPMPLVFSYSGLQVILDRLVEMLVEDVSAPLRGFQPIGGVGGAISFAYKLDPDRSVVVTIALNLLDNANYLSALRTLLREEWRWNMRLWQRSVQNAAVELVLAAVQKADVPEVAFALLGTLLRADDPSGERWREEMSVLIFRGIQGRHRDTTA